MAMPTVDEQSLLVTYTTPCKAAYTAERCLSTVCAGDVTIVLVQLTSDEVLRVFHERNTKQGCCQGKHVGFVDGVHVHSTLLGV